MATTARIGSGADSSSELVPGFMVLKAFTATLTTAMILVMVTPDRCRRVENRHLTTSTQTKRGTAKVTWAMRVMMAAVNTAQEPREVTMAAVTTSR